MYTLCLTPITHSYVFTPCCTATRVAAIKSNALTVLKIVAAFQEAGDDGPMIAPSSSSERHMSIKSTSSLTFNHMREITAQLLITLAYDESIYEALAAEPIVNILILFLNQSSGFGFECALEVNCTLLTSIYPLPMHILILHKYG